MLGEDLFEEEEIDIDVDVRPPDASPDLCAPPRLCAPWSLSSGSWLRRGTAPLPSCLFGVLSARAMSGFGLNLFRAGVRSMLTGQLI